VSVRAIVAMTPSRVIGQGGKIPWHYPEDMRWFKQTTMGNAVLMGRKTFESIGKPLPGRLNFVVSRTASFQGVEMIRDLIGFQLDRFDRDVYVIGGAEVYRTLLPITEELIVTHVLTEHPGDTFFPEYEPVFESAEKLLQTPDFVIKRYVRRPLG
jgi:dihydrofolate reductase